ncbi:TPA: Retroviral aspartyl protease [Candidatus Bathyarchaeota archaeon]|nr:Retroviral aspartyl protease [Candidatus Bathyarchaeota archaeon]
MGYVRVKAVLANPYDRSKRVELSLLADTGAIYTAIPEPILVDLGVSVTGRRRFKLASGEVEEYPVGEAYVEVEGEGVTSLVAFLPKGSTPLLGVTTLELLGLEVDPTTGKLKPMELLLL